MDAIFNLRKEIDTHIQCLGALYPSRELSLVKTSLQRSKMFLGLSLGKMGVETPYKESCNPESLQIEETADKGDALPVLEKFQELIKGDPDPIAGNIRKIKYLRSLVKETIASFEKQEPDMIEKCEKQNAMNLYNAFLFYQEAYTAINEANCWLGAELGCIKAAQEGKAAVNDPVEKSKS